MVEFYSKKPADDQVQGNIVGVKAEMGVRKWLVSKGYDLEVLFPEFTGKYRTLQVAN